MYDQNESSSISKVVKGLRILTDALPFDKKLDQFQNSPLMVQFMLLSSVFNRNATVLVVQSLIDKFREDYHFLESVWEAISFCSKLQEKRSIDFQQNLISSPDRDSNKKISHRRKSMIQRMLLDQVMSFEFNKTVQEKIIQIKDTALLFFPPLCELYARSDAHNLDSKLQIFLQFLTHSYDEAFLVKLMSIVHQTKDAYLFYFKNIGDFDEKLEEINRT